jgi:hypothetical protein
MKEDILEQIVEDWLVSQNGCFVKHNIKFRPDIDDKDYDSKKDSVHSDIDILSINTKENKYEKVYAITCKSWQSGFNAKLWLDELEKDISQFEKKDYGRDKWKYFRELVVPKWTKAFVEEIYKQTNTKCFTYCIACTKIINNRCNEIVQLQNSELFKQRFNVFGADVKIKVITFEEMIKEYFSRIDKKSMNTLESTDIGRLLQLIRSSKVKI